MSFRQCLIRMKSDMFVLTCSLELYESEVEWCGPTQVWFWGIDLIEAVFWHVNGKGSPIAGHV